MKNCEGTWVIVENTQERVQACVTCGDTTWTEKVWEEMSEKLTR